MKSNLRKGITLIEMLIIVTIFGIIAAVAIPWTANRVIAERWNVVHGGMTADNVSDLELLGLRSEQIQKMSPDEVQSTLKSIVRGRDGEILNKESILHQVIENRTAEELSADINKLQKELELKKNKK